MGIVSALHRTKMGVNTFENFIQTDAAINEGNSGGALIDSNGNWLASIISSSILVRATTPVMQVLAFAIPVSTLQQVAEELIKTGKVSRGYIGASESKHHTANGQSIQSAQRQRCDHRQCRDQRAGGASGCKWVIF